MSERISFTLKFTFEEGDSSKAIRLHEYLKKYGVISRISFLKGTNIKDKQSRYRAILNCMKYDEEYTTGGLWKRYAKYTSGGVKTFQRDLNTMVITGLIIGRTGMHPSRSGRTCYWSKVNIYEEVVE